MSVCVGWLVGGCAAELLIISIKNVSEAGSSYLQVRIQNDSMELVGEIVQDMGQYFKVEDLESVCEFPQEIASFEEVVNQVAECNSARVNLAADMADDSQRIKVMRQHRN